MNYPWQLYHWHFEVSGKCTLQCPRCPRNEMAKVPWFNNELDLNFFKTTLTPDLLKNEVKRITMCGDIGDPIYASQYLEIIDYIKTQNSKIHIYTITNGSHKKASWWKDFASISNEYDTVNFSIDGYDNASNNMYRINSNWDSIMQGMEIMCQDSPAFVYWATILFSFNQDHLDTIETLARDKGCDGLQLTHSTKFGSKYGEAYGGKTDNLEPRPEFISPTHRYVRHFIKLTERDQLIDDYIKENRIKFFDVSNEYGEYITPMCSIGNRGLYVSADGILHPCSWVSYPYKELTTDRKTIKFEDSFHQVYRDKLNLKQRPLVDVLNDPVWDKLFSSFSEPCKAWVECEQKCHRDLVDYDYAVGYLTN